MKIESITRRPIIRNDVKTLAAKTIDVVKNNSVTKNAKRAFLSTAAALTLLGVSSCNTNKAEQISFERNEKINNMYICNHNDAVHDDYDRQKYNKSLATIDEYYSNKGTYGAVMDLQRETDFVMKRSLMHMPKEARQLVLKNLGINTDIYEDWSDYDEQNRDYTNDDYISVSSRLTDASRAWSREVEELIVKNVDQFVAHQKEKAKRDLYANGDTPTLDQVSAFIDRQVASLDFLPMAEYEKYLEDVAKYQQSKKTQTTSDMSDVIAYKQFKLDSLFMGNLLKSCGYFEYEELAREFKECYSPKKPGLDDDGGFYWCPNPTFFDLKHNGEDVVVAK